MADELNVPDQDELEQFQEIEEELPVSDGEEEEIEQDEQEEEEDTPSQSQQQYTPQQLREMRALIDAQLEEWGASGSKEESEDEEEDDTDTFWQDFDDSIWIDDETKTALKTREEKQQAKFQKMLDEQAAAFAAMLDQVADKTPAVNRVIQTIQEEVPEEFIPELQNLLSQLPIAALSNFSTAYANPETRNQIMAAIDQEYGAWKRKGSKPSKSPVGVASGGAPASNVGVSRAVRPEQKAAWEAHARVFLSDIKDEKELKRKEAEYYKDVYGVKI